MRQECTFTAILTARNFHQVTWGGLIEPPEVHGHSLKDSAFSFKVQPEVYSKFAMRKFSRLDDRKFSLPHV